jgi:hypothetical protein
MFTRESRLEPRKSLIISAKGLLQQYLPRAAVSRCSKQQPLFDHLVGADHQGQGHSDVERFGGF